MILYVLGTFFGTVARHLDNAAARFLEGYHQTRFRVRPRSITNDELHARFSDGTAIVPIIDLDEMNRP